MELFDLTCTIDKAVCVILSVIRVMAFLFSFVLKYTVLDSTGKDAGHGVFWLSINLNQRWRRFNLTGQWIHGCFMKPISAENGKYLG